MTKDRVFFGALALATLLPLIGVSFGLFKVASLPMLLTVTSYWHVASTAFSYFDPEFRPLIKAEPVRFLWPALALPTLMVAIFLANPLMGNWATLGYLFWQGYHYQRQNYGLCALAAKTKLPDQLSLGLNLAAIGGTLGILRFPAFARVDLPEAVVMDLWLAGLILSGVAIALVIYSVIREPALRRPRALTFVAMSSVFFLPSLLCADPMVAFWSYAIAHGAQYLICQGLVVVRSGMGWRRLLAGSAAAGMLGIFGYGATQSPLVMQAWLGLVMVHFLADAKLWRMREPLQRGVVRRRLSFLFAG